MRRALRYTLAITLLATTALMLAVTLMSPAIAATAPAVLTLGLAAATFVAWPKRRRKEAR